MGYHRAGFDVVGIDNQPMPRYPFEFHQADAFEYLKAHGHEFDAIHASPPCQEYSAARHLRAMNAVRFNRSEKFADKLIPETRAALVESGKVWVLENVPRSPMPSAIELCGSMFGLPLLRHRWFEASILLFAARECHHPDGFYSAIGGKIRGHGTFDSGKHYLDRHGRAKRREGYPGKAAGVAAMGIDWMTVPEMCQAIPPVYTEWIGMQLISVLEPEVA